MNRWEIVLLVLAVLLLSVPVGLTFYLAPQTQDYSTDSGVPFAVVLRQLLGVIGPSLLLVGLACVVGILFLRAVRRASRVTEHPVEETD